MQRYNGLRERPDKDGLYGFIRQPVTLDEFNDIIAEGSVYFAGNPKAFDGQIVAFVREEKDGGMLYRLSDRRKKPYPPPDGKRVRPRSMIMSRESATAAPRATLQKTGRTKENEAHGHTEEPPFAGKGAPTITYRQEWTRCNNERCKKCKDSKGHGPYWYAYWREDEKVKKKYVGKSRQ